MTDSKWYWQKRTFPFNARLASNEPAYMIGVDVAWSPLAEIIGSAGAEAAFIDMEHTTLSLEEVEHLIIACDAAGISSLVRVPHVDPKLVSRVLDSGAHGVIYPDIRTVDEAKLAIAATKYPPAGRRAWGGAHTRSVMWEGALASKALQEPDPSARGIYSDHYIDYANGNAHVTILVESPAGVEILPEIVKLPGLDAIWFGWADFSTQVDFDLEKCTQAADFVYQTCREAGVGVCLAVDSVETQPWFPGCFYFAGLDTLLLANAIRTAVGNAKQRVSSARQSAGSPADY